MSEFKRTIKRGPIENWWKSQEVAYANVPGGVVMKISHTEHDDIGISTTASLTFIPGAVLVFKEYEDIIRADEFEPEEEVKIRATKLVNQVSIRSFESEGWKEFK